jgi:hypothetical protein
VGAVQHRVTVPRAEVMGVIGVAALIANVGVAVFPHRRRLHALSLDLLPQ